MRVNVSEALLTIWVPYPEPVQKLVYQTIREIDELRKYPYAVFGFTMIDELPPIKEMMDQLSRDAICDEFSRKAKKLNLKALDSFSIDCQDKGMLLSMRCSYA